MSKRTPPQGMLIAVVSDLHCGSTVGLATPDPVTLDDGGTYVPTDAQRWLWRHWLGYWATVRRLAAGRNLIVILNGDAMDGDHHGTAQIVSRHPGTQFDILLKCLAVPLALRPRHVIVVRGTESHVGKSGSGEEALARHLLNTGVPVVPCPDTKTASWWHFTGTFGPLLVSATHHGRIGQRPWTKGNVSSNLAAQIFYEHAARGQRHPDIALRSHYHKTADSGDSHPVRVIQTPAWQLATAYAYRVAADSLADVGGLTISIDNAEWTVRKHLAVPDPTPTWSIA